MNTHSGLLSPSHLFSAALIAAFSLAAPRANADLYVNGTKYNTKSSILGIASKQGSGNCTFTYVDSALKLTGSGPYTLSGSITAPVILNAQQSSAIVLDNFTVNTSKGAALDLSNYSATIEFKGTCILKSTKSESAGIRVPSGKTIYLRSTDGTLNHTLTCTAGSNAAGIGGNSGDTSGSIYVRSGTIIANGGAKSSSNEGGGAGIGGGRQGAGTLYSQTGGNVTAKGGTSAAGIGGGYGSAGDGGIVALTNCVLTATGGSGSGTTSFDQSGGAGIGGGNGGDGATVTIYNSTVTANGGFAAAGIGSSNGGVAKSVKVHGTSLVTATGGNSGAGIGGGYNGAGGAFYQYDGTVVANKGSASATDIGAGRGSSTASLFCVMGGSCVLSSDSSTKTCEGYTDDVPVYRVRIRDLSAGEHVTLSDFDAIDAALVKAYGKTGIYATSSGKVDIWLPNGDYEFACNGETYVATVAGDATTAIIKPTTSTITFKDWDGTTISEYTADPGAALTAPANPSRTGYTFTGWSPEAPSAFPEKNTTYIAQYTANQYTLTFYDEDGTTVLDTITQDCDSAVTAPSPAKAEYIFSGWSPDVPATMPPGNLSFTAKWELAPYFRLVSVTPGTDGKVTVKYDSYNTDLTKGDFTLTVKDANGAVAATITEWEKAPSTEAGEQTAVWDAKDFIAGLSNPADYTFTLSVGAEAEAKYLVIDLSNGSKTYLADVPEGGWTDEYKTTKLVLRKILGEGETATFTMGSPTTEAGRTDNETQHSVTLTKPYWMGVFEVTQKQWELVKAEASGSTTTGDTLPVETISWNKIKGYNNNYSISETTAQSQTFFGKLQSLSDDTGLNLPTEAEWEYACRAGTTTGFNDGSDIPDLGDSSAPASLGGMAVFDDGTDAYKTPIAVGSKKPNAFGLYDMHGNVWEWVHDTATSVTGSDPTYYPTDYAGAETDPVGKVTDYTNVSSYLYHIYRGGSHYNYASALRSASRRAMSRDKASAHIGFRVAAREFAGVAKVGSQIDAENTVSATLGKKPRKGFVMMVY